LPNCGNDSQNQLRIINQSALSRAGAVEVALKSLLNGEVAYGEPFLFIGSEQRRASFSS